MEGWIQDLNAAPSGRDPDVVPEVVIADEMAAFRALAAQTG